MHVIFDYRVAPNSFDFATFLANAFIYSRATGRTINEISLVECAYRGDSSWGDRIVPIEYHERKAESVALTLSRMLIDKPSIYSYRKWSDIKSWSIDDSFPPGFDPKAIPKDAFSPTSLLPCSEVHTNQLYEQTKILPHPFSTDADLVDQVKSQWGNSYATLTIRNSPLNPQRNDDKSLLTSFRQPLLSALRKRGVRLVLIPDRENMNPRDEINMFDGQEVDVEAAFSLRKRLALYAGARINITPATGPNILLVFSPYPYFMYGVYDPTIPIMSKDFFARKGPAFGLQRPWALPSQRTDWTSREDFDPANAIATIEQLFR